MNLKQFQSVAKEWPISDHFYCRMKYAILNKVKAKFSPESLTKMDMKFLEEHGYELEIENMEVAV